jgi:hypothetical protein
LKILDAFKSIFPEGIGLLGILLKGCYKNAIEEMSRFVKLVFSKNEVEDYEVSPLLTALRTIDLNGLATFISGGKILAFEEAIELFFYKEDSVYKESEELKFFKSQNIRFLQIREAYKGSWKDKFCLFLKEKGFKKENDEKNVMFDETESMVKYSFTAEDLKKQFADLQDKLGKELSPKIEFSSISTLVRGSKNIDFFTFFANGQRIADLDFSFKIGFRL